MEVIGVKVRSRVIGGLLAGVMTIGLLAGSTVGTRVEAAETISQEDVSGASTDTISQEDVSGDSKDTISQEDTSGESAGEVSTESVGSTSGDLEGVTYVALGDSIPNGYIAADEEEMESYPYLITQDLENMGECQVEFSGYTKNGLTTAGLNTKYLADPEVEEKLETADIITITIGSNDLLNEFKDVSQNILKVDTKFKDAPSALSALQEGVADNPLMLVSVVKAITSWDYEAFETDWVTLMDTLKTDCQEDPQIIVTTIYNPVAGTELPGTLNAVVNSVIGGMNDVIIDYAEVYGYQVADLLGVGIEEHTQSDGLHPNQEGNRLIADLIESKLDYDRLLKATGESSEEVAEELEEQLEEKAEVIEEVQHEQQGKRLAGYMKTAACLVICILVLVLARIVFLRLRKH
jgi:lysophospholipase L1-like esterase